MANYKQALISESTPIYFYTPADAVYFEETTEDGEIEKVYLPKKIESLSTSNAGIKSVQYAASSEFIKNDKWNDYISNAAWSPTMPELDYDKRFLYLKITFENEDPIITFAGSLGKSGEAGVGIEWVYQATKNDTKAVKDSLETELKNSIKEADYQNPGRVPENWTDSLPEPTDELPIVFGARRIYKNGTWEAWSAPIIVARKFTITDGENTFLKKTEEDIAQKRITFEDGITTYGNVDFNNQDGAANKTQINTTLDVTGNAYFKNLTVSGQAHFSTLVLDEIKAAGGTYLFSVANPFTVKKVEEEDAGYKVWWKAESENSLNTWAADDYAICAQWNNVKTGTNTNACNKYYWAKVVEASAEKAGDYEVDGDYCHWIIISNTDKDGNGIPEVGDNIAQLGNSSDTNRQSAIVISSYHWIDSNVHCPAFVQYTGINSFSLEGCIRNKIDKEGTTLKGNFSSENNETFVTKDGLEETITNNISSQLGDISFLTTDNTKTAGLTINLNEGITLEASKTTITGDLNIKGLITDSISQIDNSIYAHGNSVLIPIDMNTVKSVEVSPNNIEIPPIVLLPMYDDQTIVAKTSTDSGLTIPGYTQSGTHLIIRNPFNPAYSLWNVDSNTLWDTDRKTIMKQLIVICVDPRLLKESNYYDDSKAYINPSAMEDYAGGVYFNGRRGRFICLLPGQQIELISTIKTVENKSYLSWYGSGSNIEGFSQDFKFVSGAAPNVAVSYTKLPSNSGWGTTTGIYEDAIFGYSKLASSGQWEVNWAQGNYPSLTVN